MYLCVYVPTCILFAVYFPQKYFRACVSFLLQSYMYILQIDFISWLQNCFVLTYPLPIEFAFLLWSKMLNIITKTKWALRAFGEEK